MRNLIIILFTSIIVWSVTLISNRHLKEVNFIKESLNTNNRILENTNNVIYSAIKKQVIKYPGYQHFLPNLDTIRPLILEMRTLTKPSYKDLYRQVAMMDHYAVVDLERDLDTAIIETKYFQNEVYFTRLKTEHY